MLALVAIVKTITTENPRLSVLKSLNETVSKIIKIDRVQ